jgi:hypothetical protein
MRVLEAASAGLSLTSAAIIISFLAGGGDKGLLHLAAFCCFLVAVYQVVNFYLGNKLQHRVEQPRADSSGEIKAEDERSVGVLGPGDATSLGEGRSIVENTTQLLEPIPRRAKRDK